MERAYRILMARATPSKTMYRNLLPTSPCTMQQAGSVIVKATQVVCSVWHTGFSPPQKDHEQRFPSPQKGSRAANHDLIQLDIAGFAATLVFVPTHAYRHTAQCRVLLPRLRVRLALPSEAPPSTLFGFLVLLCAVRGSRKQAKPGCG